MATFPTFRFRAALELTDEIPIAPPGQVEMERTSIELLAELLGVASSGGGAVDSVFGRVGAVVAAAGDYSADQIDYESGDVAGALDALAALIAGTQPHDATLDALAALAWSAGVQVIAFTAADTLVLKTVGSASGNLLDKSAGDSLYQPLDATLTAAAALSWSAGIQVLTLTAADTFTLKTVGQAAGNIIDKAAGDALYASLSATSTQNLSATFLGLKNATSGQYLALANTDTTASALRGLNFNMNNATRALSMSGDLTVSSGGATVGGVNTGDQTITLTGDVTGSGTGSFATTFKDSPAFTGAVTITNTVVTAPLTVKANGGGQFVGERFSSDASGATVRLHKGRGSIASPSAAVTNDEAFRLIGRHYYDASNTVENFHLVDILKAATPSATNGESGFALKLCPAASATITTFLSGDFATGLSLASNVVIDQNRHLALRSYTVATLPAATTAARLIYVSDGTSNKRLAVSDGTNWRWPDGAIVS